MTTSEELRRGEQARQLLQNELYVDSIEQVKQAIIDKWQQAPLRDREGHHELKLMLKLLGELTGYIQTTMETGKMAQIQLDSERKQQLVRRAVGWN